MGYWTGAVISSRGFAYLIATYLYRTSFLERTLYGKAIGIILALLSMVAADALIIT